MVGLRVNDQVHPRRKGTAMKTVPTVRLADTTDAVVLADLPEEIALALADIAGVAREGLLAMSVAAGMAVMAAMFEAEIAAASPGQRVSTTRTGTRCATAPGRGSVTLGGRPGSRGAAAGAHRRRPRGAAHDV